MNTITKTSDVKTVSPPLEFTNDEAAGISQESINFSFGGNWKKYFTKIEEPTIRRAEKSFTDFTRFANLDGQTFLDVGCGSGLSSLIAYRLGAKRIVSVDIDPNSIDCATALRTRFAGQTSQWDIVPGSALDPDFPSAVGKFSYVYSWGVLHHTGAMWKAIENVISCVEPGGKLHIALYNAHKNSERWLTIKRLCNRFPRTIFPILKFLYEVLAYVRLVARFQSPLGFLREYRERRGMDFRRDTEDWLGGLPYEYCKPDQVVDFLSDRGFVLSRLRTSKSTGCNEFLFINTRKVSPDSLSK